MRIGMALAAAMALSLAALASTAHAGGGGAGVPVDATVYDCYLVAGGASPGHVLTLDDQFSPDKGWTGVKLGTAKLLCTPTTGATVTSGHDVRAGLPPGDHLMCYEAAGVKSPKTEVQVVDPFAAETVKVGVAKYVCVTASKCPVGQPCPPE